MSIKSTKPDTVWPHDELEVLHAGLGALISRFKEAEQTACAALWISRQLRLIAEHPSLPDPGLRPLYRTMAARWHVRAAYLD